MADDQEIDQVVKWLLPFYLQLSELNTSTLNTGLRKGLRLLAAKYRLQYTQDDIGNIYIHNPGRDQDMPSMGLCFPLDASKSPETFEGSLRTFLALRNYSFACGITLVGWSSPEGSIIGREAWHGHLSPDDIYRDYVDIKQFTGMTSVDTFSMSALFEISVSQNDPIKIEGSPVLVQKATSAAQIPVKAVSNTRIGRAPEIKMEGDSCVSLGVSTVEMYNKYLTALFDNFD